MAYQRPAWAEAVKNALSGLYNQQPAPLLPLLAIFAGDQVTEGELADFVEHAEENDPALTQLRLALGRWDAASDDFVLLDAQGNATAPDTAPRRHAVYAALQLGDLAS